MTLGNNPVGAGEQVNNNHLEADRARNKTGGDEAHKMLKKLGYPEVEEPAKALGMIPKVLTAVTKRLTKLDDLKKELEKSAGTSQVAQKSLGQTSLVEANACSCISKDAHQVARDLRQARQVE